MIWITLCTLVLTLQFAESVAADDFDNAFSDMDYQIANKNKNKNTAVKAARSELQEWKASQAEDYLSYKNAYLTALSLYKDDILKHWNEAEVTNKKIWVEYSRDLQAKRVVDYEKNEIRISMLGEIVDDKKINNLIDKNLREILTKTPSSARKSDPVLSALTKTKVEPKPSIKTGQEKILSELLPKKKSLAENLDVLKKQAVVSRQSNLEKTQANESAAGSVVVTIKLPQSAIGQRASKYQEVIEKYALKNKIPPSLVFAIMHTESAFNPMARSHIPAYGLMQIVPESAGRDVAKRLYKKDQIFSAEYLYDENNNVQAGSTYINILFYSYLKGVDDPISRFYCVVAAYNTGAGNVAKAFIGNRNLSKALPVINNMTPQEVYETLVKQLPYEETQEYLKRVVKRQKLYSNV